MRKFSAHRIYPVHGDPINYGIIETLDDGTIVRVRDTGGVPTEEHGVEFFSGVIIPGMVNAHCHLELSHLAGKIPEHTGLTGFVRAINLFRPDTAEHILQAAREADRYMYRDGISGAGDISNNRITLSIKQESQLLYHTYLEVFGLNEQVAADRFKESRRLAGCFQQAGLSCSISPHAPYSMGTGLWQLLSGEKAFTRRISIHHDESDEERELLEYRTGVMADGFRGEGSDLSVLPDEASSVFRLLDRYLPTSVCSLVHNTVTHPLQSDWANRPAVYWVLCPRSNQYIEDRLPDLSGFNQSSLTVCLGTDSLASNRSLSILEEMKTIQAYAPDISFDTLLQWATINGARALGFEQQLGTLEPGKRPGLVNIPVFDWEANHLLTESVSCRLI